MTLSLLIVILFMGLPPRRYECVCIRDPQRTQDQINDDRRKAFDNSKAVFEGKVVAIDHQTVKFELSKSWKGTNGEVISLSTGAFKGVDGTFIPGECGYQFRLGQEYLIFAIEVGDNIETNACLTFSLKDAAQEEKGLDEIRLHETIKHTVQSTPAF